MISSKSDNPCPGRYPVFGGYMECDLDDEYRMGNHSSFLHRNKNFNKEWPIDAEDKKRWGLLTTKKRDARVTEVKSDNPETIEENESGTHPDQECTA